MKTAAKILFACLALALAPGWTTAAAAAPAVDPGTGLYIDPASGYLIPDYFGVANWANSPPLRKFVDLLPPLGCTTPNNLDQCIPVALADDAAYPGSDYYEIAVVDYDQRMHSDLPPTRLRGYVQLETAFNSGQSSHYPLTYPGGAPILDAGGNQVYALEKPQYLGPMIVAQKDRPVRVKFVNYLATGEGGDLFIPVDTSIMGAGPGRKTEFGADCMDPADPLYDPNNSLTACVDYTENRAVLHLHGGLSPWISDGTRTSGSPRPSRFPKHRSSAPRSRTAARSKSPSPRRPMTAASRSPRTRPPRAPAASWSAPLPARSRSPGCPTSRRTPSP